MLQFAATKISIYPNLGTIPYFRYLPIFNRGYWLNGCYTKVLAYYIETNPTQLDVWVSPGGLDISASVVQAS